MSFIRRGRGSQTKREKRTLKRSSRPGRRRTVVQEGNTTRGGQPWGMAAQDEQGWAGDQRAPKGKLITLPAPEGYYLVTKSNSNFLPISMSPTLTNSNR